MPSNTLCKTVTEALAISNSTPALMLDYDGTLTPIAPRPEEALLSGTQYGALLRLTTCASFPIAIVSGRSIAQLLPLLRDLSKTPILLCGSHGGEIYVPATQTFLQQPDFARIQPLMSHFRACLKQALDEAGLMTSGLLLEEKTFSTAVHVRLVPEEALKQQVLRVFESVYEALPELKADFKLMSGKQMLEVLDIRANKGAGITWLCQYWSAGGKNALFPIFAGDDLTDESGFAAVNALQGLSIRVGNPLEETRAKVVLSRIADLYGFIAELEGLGNQV